MAFFKKIDKLVFKDFIGPFVVAFGIAIFVLIMQFLWLYIDEIAGKGVGFFILVELISYLSISTFPMALPIAVLISSVMVMGNLAERYELSSMKSAGVSLLRIMRVLVLAGIGISFFSYLCSDFIIPIANLKFKSRLYDIRRQKPALTLEAGVFNDDFLNFVIRIGEKEQDNETIKDVLIEENKSGGAEFNQILSDSGRMFTTADQRYFVMNLYNGTQYQEPARESRGANEKMPFVRVQFKEWTKVFDLSEFDMTRTNEDRLSTQRSMMNMQELRDRIDTLELERQRVLASIATDITLNLHRNLKVEMDTSMQSGAKSSLDSARQAILKERFAQENTVQSTLDKNPLVPIQVFVKPLTSYSSLLETFDKRHHDRLKNQGQSTIRGYRNSLSSRENQAKNRRIEGVKTAYELYIKYTFALVCTVFMFIGATMGALIRKGGFGYPILVSIVFFVFFVFLTIMCKELAEAEKLTPFWAGMLPCLVLVPIAGMMTYFAVHDGSPPNPIHQLQSLRKS